MPLVPVKIIEISKDTHQLEERLEEMVQVLCQGLSNDPITLPALGVPYEVNPEPLEAFQRVQLRVALTGAGRVFAAFLDVGGVERIVGLAIWYGPGRDFLDDKEHVTYWASAMGILSPDIQKWRQDVMLPRYEQLIMDGLGPGVKKESLYLKALVVLPEWHQKGIGKQLVQHTLGQNEFREIGSCVETTKENNVRGLYPNKLTLISSQPVTLLWPPGLCNQIKGLDAVPTWRFYDVVLVSGAVLGALIVDLVW